MEDYLLEVIGEVLVNPLYKYNHGPQMLVIARDGGLIHLPAAKL